MFPNELIIEWLTGLHNLDLVDGERKWEYDRNWSQSIQRDQWVWEESGK